MRRLESRACFGGRQEVWEFAAKNTDSPMKVGVYLPPGPGPFPVLYWLSGLTCTEQNAMQKAGFQQHASAHGFIVVNPDTSPRGPEIPDDPSYDLGQGASFYVDATAEPWRRHFQMATWITQELPAWVQQNFPADDRRALSGHSMGGHGALTLALRNPTLYQSVSAFSPICAPTQVPWGRRAFSAYLGEDPPVWADWDATALVEARPSGHTLLIDQGEADEFLHSQLRPDLLVAAAERAGQRVQLRLRPDYDHSYYFIATFLGEHFQFHAANLNA